MTNKAITLKIIELATRIKTKQRDPELDGEIWELADAHGDWVIEEITTQLTKFEPGTYDQLCQDELREHGKGVEIDQSNNKVPIVSMQPKMLERRLFDEARDPLRDILLDLIPPDFHSIPRRAHLSRIETDVWWHWMQGKNVRWMSNWIYKPNGKPYQLVSLYAILDRARTKVWNYPALGWRTCLADDIARGRRAEKPSRVSIKDIIGDAES